MTHTTEAHDQALSKAKIQLMARPDSAFFTTLCFSLKHRFDEDAGTAYTDGLEVVYAPKFFMSLSPAEQLFLMLHETLHVALLHTVVFEAGLNADRANIAQDHVINLMLIEAGFKMPACGYADPQYTGMHWRQVYDLLPTSCGKPMMADVRPGKPGDGAAKAKAEALTREVQDILVRAAIQSKAAGDKPGTIPGDIQIFLNGLLNPKLPWNKLLQKYLRVFDKSDYTFRRPNRRFFPEWHMPTLHGEKLMDLAIAVDISGSVSDADFHTFVSEIASIFRMMKPGKITLLQFDTQIKSVDQLKNLGDLLKTKFAGRGGTAIEPVLAWAKENKPELLMVFTDGEFRFHQPHTNTEIVWLIHNNKQFNPPFGKTIHYEI